MSEKKLFWKVTLSILVVAVCATLYAYGGMEHKYLRRFIAPAVCVAYMFAVTKDPRVFVNLTMMGSLCLGYGGVGLVEKIIRRGLFGIANGITSSGFNIFRKFWDIVIIQVSVLIIFYILYGVWNPFGSARVEEVILGINYYLIPILTIHKKE